MLSPCRQGGRNAGMPSRLPTTSLLPAGRPSNRARCRSQWRSSRHRHADYRGRVVALVATVGGRRARGAGRRAIRVAAQVRAGCALRASSRERRRCVAHGSGMPVRRRLTLSTASPWSVPRSAARAALAAASPPLLALDAIAPGRHQRRVGQFRRVERDRLQLATTASAGTSIVSATSATSAAVVATASWRGTL